MFFIYLVFISFFLLSSIVSIIAQEKRRRNKTPFNFYKWKQRHYSAYDKRNLEIVQSSDDYAHSSLSDIFTEKGNIKTFTGEIFRLADKRKGRITISDVIIQTGLPLKESEMVMDSLVDGQHVCIEIDDDGRIFYEFPEILTRHRFLKDDVLHLEDKKESKE